MGNPNKIQCIRPGFEQHSTHDNHRLSSSSLLITELEIPFAQDENTFVCRTNGTTQHVHLHG
jgi:hypothetical protein